ncbi:MAG: cell division protein ZapA [Alphaproteobacteria bacterium]|nr:cell division protein ZapA [Alphaproteobacteria bacterium]OJV13584.1 MAG: hypothetical protein BGO27_03100 [Alphaproteobacteria bacterium 33-17]
MSIVSVKIKGSNYNLSCGDGEEEQLLELAKKFDSRLTELSKAMPRASDSMLFVMAGILMEDKIRDLDNILKDKVKFGDTDGDSLNKSAEIMAEYIENLAEKLDKMYT